MDLDGDQSFDDIFDQSFEDIGLDPRLISALIQRGFQNPTPIQCVAIPVILQGKDVLLGANTRSGKTLAYLLPLLHKLLSGSGSGSGSGSNSSHMSCPTAFVLVPSMKVIQQADLLLSYGYEDDLRVFMSHVPTRCQCLMMTVISSNDVEKLKNLILHNPYQFWISCGAPDKFLYVLALLKFDLVQKKVLLFANRIDMGFRLKHFLEKFSITAAVLTAELSQNSPLRIVEDFNAGLFDYLIAIDDSETNTKEQETAGQDDVEMKNSKRQWKQILDAGIDFKDVYTVITCRRLQLLLDSSIVFDA